MEDRPQATEVIYGRHPVLEALRSGRPLLKIYVLASGERLPRELFEGARQQGVPVLRVERSRLDALCRGGHHQGVAATVARRAFASLQEVLEGALASGEPPFLLALDGVQDPGNLGALLRSAEAAGVHGVILPARRSVGLTPAVSRAAAGADAYLPVARVGNLARTLEEMARSGLAVVGAHPGAGQDLYAADLTGPLVLVLGGEGPGLEPSVARACTRLVRIPLRGRVESLNVSAAGAVLLFEVRRQRDRGEGTRVSE